MSTLKKFFYLSLVILTLTLLFWGVYNLAFKKSAPKSSTPTSEEKTILPEITPKKEVSAIRAITEEAVIAPVITEKNDTIKYYAKSGQVYEIDLTGQNKKIISPQQLSGLTDILWSPDKTKVISQFSTSAETKFYLYDYKEQKGVPLKSNLDEVAWQTAGNKIFYKYYDPRTKERTLNISDPDGANWQKLTDLNYKNVAIAQVPKTGLVSFWNKPDANNETNLETMPLVGGEKKSLLKGKFGTDYLWGPSGNNILVSHTDQKAGNKMQLAVMNYNGGEFKNLLAPTMVSKCVWSSNNKNIFCAFPGNIPETAITPNEYLENKFTTVDTFWKIDTVTGEKTRLLETEKLSAQVDATNLFLNDDESILFFVNRADGRLYRLDM